jgi:uncharacterized membrane protein YraQ (UPF0718 family)
MNQIVQHFLHLLGEVTPWFLFGVILAAGIQAFIKPEWVTRWISSKRAAEVSEHPTDGQFRLVQNPC